MIYHVATTVPCHYVIAISFTWGVISKVDHTNWDVYCSWYPFLQVDGVFFRQVVTKLSSEFAEPALQGGRGEKSIQKW